MFVCWLVAGCLFSWSVDMLVGLSQFPKNTGTEVTLIFPLLCHFVFQYLREQVEVEMLVEVIF